jgi:hypothetical protein
MGKANTDMDTLIRKYVLATSEGLHLGELFAEREKYYDIAHAMCKKAVRCKSTQNSK